MPSSCSHGNVQHGGVGISPISGSFSLLLLRAGARENLSRPRGTCLALGLCWGAPAAPGSVSGPCHVRRGTYCPGSACLFSPVATRSSAAGLPCLLSK